MKKVSYLLPIISLSFLFSNEPITYGWNIPNTPLNVGAYIDLMYDEEREGNVVLDDISLLISDNHDHFKILGEVEISNLTLDGKSNNSLDIEINLERLQVGYAFDDKHHITVGRFNSDIGFWNQSPINILQDTTTEPHMLKYVFPKATTGVMYQNYFSDESSFSMTLQHNEDIGQKDESIVLDRHVALSYHGVMDDFSWRVAGGFYREINQFEARYFGLGAEYDVEEFTLQGELFTQKSNRRENKPYSGYIQSVWHLFNRQDAVVRFEGYNDKDLAVEESIYLLGYLYRPRANMAVKGEYVYHTELPLNRFVASFSVMF